MELKQRHRSWGPVELGSKHGMVLADKVECLQGDQCTILGSLQ